MTNHTYTFVHDPEIGEETWDRTDWADILECSEDEATAIINSRCKQTLLECQTDGRTVRVHEMVASEEHGPAEWIRERFHGLEDLGLGIWAEADPQVEGLEQLNVAATALANTIILGPAIIVLLDADGVQAEEMDHGPVFWHESNGLDVNGIYA